MNGWTNGPFPGRFPVERERSDTLRQVRTAPACVDYWQATPPSTATLQLPLTQSASLSQNCPLAQLGPHCSPQSVSLSVPAWKVPLPQWVGRHKFAVQIPLWHWFAPVHATL